jgi:hypothetical protein
MRFSVANSRLIVAFAARAALPTPLLFDFGFCHRVPPFVRLVRRVSPPLRAARCAGRGSGPAPTPAPPAAPAPLAQAWQEWGTHRRRTDRAAWVASSVNRVFGKIRFIHPKWVNQNSEAIEALTTNNWRSAGNNSGPDPSWTQASGSQADHMAH